MSISNTTNKVRFTGNALTVDFDFSFKIFAAGDLKVYLITTATGASTLQTLTTDYTVSINSASEGGTVTMNTAPAATEELLIVRVLDLTQPTTIPTESNIPETQLENAYDRSVMQIQQLQEEIDRSAKVSQTTNADVQLPSPNDGKAILWDGTSGTMKNSINNFDNIVTEAEAAQTAAEAAQTAAEAAQAGAEAAETNAEAAQTAAEAAQAVAEAAASSLGDNPAFLGEEGMVPPDGTTAQRPGSPRAGETRYNTTRQTIEMYLSGAWIPVYKAEKPGFINIGLSAETTSETNDSIKITGANGSSLSATNPGYVIMPSNTPGQIVSVEVTADVTIDLTGANFGLGGYGDITSQQLSVYALYDGAGLKWGVTYHSDKKEFADSLDSSTATDIDDATEILVNSALTADASAQHLGYFFADFDDTGGASEDLWSINSGLGSIVLGEAPKKNKIVYVEDVKADATDGGNAAANTIQTRDLNTVKGDSEVVSVTSNKVKLKPGTYKTKAKCAGYRVNTHRAYIYNDTDTSYTLEGLTNFQNSAAATSDYAEVEGIFTITKFKEFELRHWTQGSQSGNGLGEQNLGTGDAVSNEIYARWEINMEAQ